MVFDERDVGGGTRNLRNARDTFLAFAKDPGARQPTGRFDVVIPQIRAPTAVVTDGGGTIYVGTMGSTSPGNTSTLLAYRAGNTIPEVVARDLPTIKDLSVDGKDNLYIAGFGSDDGPKTGVAFLRAGRKEIVPLIQGHQVNCLTLDRWGNVYYSPGRLKDAIRVLQRAD